MKTGIFSLFTLCLITLSTHTHAAQVNKHFIINTADFCESIGKGVEYIEDPHSQYDAGQVAAMFAQGSENIYTKQQLQFGYTDSTYWIKIPVAAELATGPGISEKVRVFLTVAYPLLDQVQLYIKQQTAFTEVLQGDHLPQEDRLFKINNFVFPIDLINQQATVLYLRIKSTSSLSIPIKLEGEKAFVENQFITSGLDGLYFGIVIGLAIYNFFLWLGTRKSVYLIYVFGVVSVSMFNANLSGYIHLWWDSSSKLQQASIFLNSSISAFACTLFCMSFLKTKQQQPKLHTILKLSNYCILALLPSYLLLELVTTAKINSLVMLTNILLLFGVATLSQFKGYAPAKYYLIGQGAVLLSIAFTVLASQGVIELYHLAPIVMKWSSAFELIFFSLALADRINNDRKLREQAQKNASKATEQLLEVQSAHNRELDELVKKRTRQLELVNTKLQELSSTDELTGLKNRRHLNLTLPQEYARAYRDETPIAVLMLDIDYFKALNDKYGHQMGDACLVAAANIIRNSVSRVPDLVARWGGEEFLVVLPSTDLASAKIVAEKIRSEIETTAIPYQDSAIHMTISVGIAAEIPTEREDYEQLVSSADASLYQAKEAGRNCVIS